MQNLKGQNATMSAEPESYAYFTITSALPLKDIDAHMGAAGDGRCWSNGCHRKQPGGGTYSFSRWSLLSGVERGKPINERLQSLWRRLSPLREKIIQLPAGMEGSVSCVGYFDSHLDPLEIASGHFATAAYYRLGFDCDFYFGDDFGHEEDGKPYWSW